MHAGFPCYLNDIQQVINLGIRDKVEMPELVDGIAGPVLAGGMAVLLKLGFGYIMRDCLLDKERSEKAMACRKKPWLFLMKTLFFVTPMRLTVSGFTRASFYYAPANPVTI
jgi:hypothetical protein